MKDAFGIPLIEGTIVHFAGRDPDGKPTLNRGTIDALNPEGEKVRVIRTERSGLTPLHPRQVETRRVWVDVKKVGRVFI